MTGAALHYHWLSFPKGFVMGMRRSSDTRRLRASEGNIAFNDPRLLPQAERTITLPQARQLLCRFKAILLLAPQKVAQRGYAEFQTRNFYGWVAKCMNDIFVVPITDRHSLRVVDGCKQCTQKCLFKLTVLSHGRHQVGTQSQLKDLGDAHGFQWDNYWDGTDRREVTVHRLPLLPINANCSAGVSKLSTPQSPFELPPWAKLSLRVA